MISTTSRILLLIGLITISSSVFAQSVAYPWLRTYDLSECIKSRIGVPDGYQRVQVNAGSFADWLRHLPLKKGKPPVLLFDKREKTNQAAHYAVIDIDVGEADLQQCADAVIRLRAEYLYSRKEFSGIHFNFTSGDVAKFTKWIEGLRPIVSNNRVRWTQSANRDSSYSTFCNYLTTVFTYAGSYSLSRECRAIGRSDDLRIGDIFIEGGFPGHAVIIVDMALNAETGKTVLLLAQSYMPAQDIHVLVNNMVPQLSPWYEFDPQEELHTPEWKFARNTAMRLK